ncbi:MAG: hypothetical protein ABSE55_07975 [Terracidiphilus sp.]|jgi:hypothetical protein
MVHSLLDLTWQEKIGAVIGIGIAAFGIVDAAKSFFSGINLIGFSHIKAAVNELTPPPASGLDSPFSRLRILEAIKANWVAGVGLEKQKAKAVELVNAYLSPSTAGGLAAVTSVDLPGLEIIAAKLASGTEFLPNERDLYKRFELVVSTLLDSAFYRSEGVYRHGMRALCAVVCVILGVLAPWGVFYGFSSNFLGTPDLWLGLLGGLVATPFAPIAKDISTVVGTIIGKQVRKYL